MLFDIELNWFELQIERDEFVFVNEHETIWLQLWIKPSNLINIYLKFMLTLMN